MQLPPVNFRVKILTWLKFCRRPSSKVCHFLARVLSFSCSGSPVKVKSKKEGFMSYFKQLLNEVEQDMRNN